MDLTCPDCGSTDTRSVALIYKQGTSSLETTSNTIGAGAGAGGLAGGIAATASSGSSQSLLAQEIAPPKPLDNTAGGCLLAVGVALLLIAVVFSSPIAGVIAVIVGVIGAALLKM